MNYTGFIDSCQAHFSVQYASNIELIRQKWYWCCDWQRATPESHVQNKPLVCSIGCHAQAGYSAFPFYTPTKPLIRLYFKYKTILIPKLKIFFYILDFYNKM